MQLFYHALFSVEGDPVLQDIGIPFLPQSLLILLLVDLPERLVTLAFQLLVRAGHQEKKESIHRPE